MASIAQQLIGSVQQTTRDQANGQDLAQAVGLGLQISKVQQQRQAIEQQKKSLHNASLDKFAAAYQKGINLPDAARKNYMTKFLPRFRDQLGLAEIFPDETLQFINSDPAMQAAVNGLILEAANPDSAITPSQVPGIVNDPQRLAEWAQSSQIQLGDVTEGAELSEEQLKELARNARNREQARAQRSRQAQQQAQFEQREQRQLEQNIEKDAKDLSTRVRSEGIIEFQSALEEVEAAIPGIVSQGRVDTPDIPGFGAFEGKLNTFFLSPEGRKVRQKVASLRNAVIKAGGGKALTESEKALFTEALGVVNSLVDVKTEQELIDGVQTTKNLYNNLVRSVRASVRPEALNLAQQRGVRLEEFAASGLDPTKESAVLGRIESLRQRGQGDAVILEKLMQQLQLGKSEALKLMERARGK